MENKKTLIGFCKFACLFVAAISLIFLVANIATTKASADLQDEPVMCKATLDANGGEFDETSQAKMEELEWTLDSPGEAHKMFPHGLGFRWIYDEIYQIIPVNGDHRFHDWICESEARSLQEDTTWHAYWENIITASFTNPDSECGTLRDNYDGEISDYFAFDVKNWQSYRIFNNVIMVVTHKDSLRFIAPQPNYEAGYNFDKWVDENGNPIPEKGTFEEHNKFFVKWNNDVTYYTTTFHANGGEFDKDKVEAEGWTYDDSETIHKQYLKEKFIDQILGDVGRVLPYYEGHKFIFWQYDSPSMYLTQDTDFTARWDTHFVKLEGYVYNWPNGYVIPEADLCLTNLNTQKEEHTTTREDGTYTYIELEWGVPYSLTIQKEGFLTKYMVFPEDYMKSENVSGNAFIYEPVDVTVNVKDGENENPVPEAYVEFGVDDLSNSLSQDVYSGYTDQDGLLCLQVPKSYDGKPLIEGKWTIEKDEYLPYVSESLSYTSSTTEIFYIEKINPTPPTPPIPTPSPIETQTAQTGDAGVTAFIVLSVILIFSLIIFKRRNRKCN